MSVTFTYDEVPSWSHILTYGFLEIRFRVVVIEVELELRLVGVRDDCHAHRLRPDREPIHHLTDELELAPEVRTPDAVGFVQDKHDICRIASAS